MNDDWINDLVALFHQMCNEQVGDLELNLTGRVIEYDVTTNMVRVLLDTRRSEDDDGTPQPMETGFMQLGSPIVGDGWGLQYCLAGGATVDNQDGEWVQVSIQDRREGVAVVANLCFTDEMTPPGAGTDDDTADSATDTDGEQRLQPKEFILKHESGSFLKFYADGSVRLVSEGSLFAEVTGDAKVTVSEGNVDLTVSEGNVSASVNGSVNIATTTGDMNLTSGGNINMSATTGNVNITGLNISIIDLT